MTNKSNLRPFCTLTTEEQREIASKGGRASVAARRKKRAEQEENKRVIEIMQELLSLAIRSNGKRKVKSDSIDRGDSLESIKNKNISVKAALGVALIQKGLQGDTKAIEAAFRMAGEDIKAEQECLYFPSVIITGEDLLED